jgi:hypothetical protein
MGIPPLRGVNNSLSWLVKPLRGMKKLNLPKKKKKRPKRK